jgi:hypothetical protein
MVSLYDQVSVRQITDRRNGWAVHSGRALRRPDGSHPIRETSRMRVMERCDAVYIMQRTRVFSYHKDALKVLGSQAFTLISSPMRSIHCAHQLYNALLSSKIVQINMKPV